MFYILNKKDIRNIVEETIEKFVVCRKDIEDVVEDMVNNELEKIKNHLMNYEDFALDYYAELFSLVEKEVKRTTKKYGKV